MEHQQAEPVEVTVKLDAGTARFLQTCVQRGGTIAAAAAEQLRALALADAARHITAWEAAHPGYAEDAEAEALAALDA
jgi:hypothetical protein